MTLFRFVFNLKCTGEFLTLADRNFQKLVRDSAEIADYQRKTVDDALVGAHTIDDALENTERIY